MNEPKITLHGTELSGHVHRVALFLDLLALPYRRSEATAAVRGSPEFLRMNPLGQIPVLEDGGLVIPDSNAILVYLAKRYAPASHWLPEEPVAAARVQRWLSVAAGEVKFGPAAARIIAVFGAPGDPGPAKQLAARVFQFMEAHLENREYLATEQPTIADLACYSYTAHAPEGGVSLEPYPAIRSWLGRIEALPNFRGMPRSAPPAAGAGVR